LPSRARSTWWRTTSSSKLADGGSRLSIAGYGFAPLKLSQSFDYHALFLGVDERESCAGY
jgi:hypothetical protein